MSPVICGDFNVHESSWLHSTHTTGDAILDLVLSEHHGLVQQLPNLNTSDHVTILLTLQDFSIPSSAPPDRRVFHWSRAPRNKLFRYFSSYQWKFSESVKSSVAYFTNVIVLATHKFIPSCVPRLSRPTPWWNAIVRWLGRRCQFGIVLMVVDFTRLFLLLLTSTLQLSEVTRPGFINHLKLYW